MNNRTKIIATIGPASSETEIIEKMARAGMDVARLNLSHGTHAQHAAFIKCIRKAEAAVGKPLGILADLGGPKIRTGKLHAGAPLELRHGDSITFAPEKEVGHDDIPLTYPDLAKDVRPGTRMLLDDGNIEVEVSKIFQKRITARVVNGGILRDHKGINLPELTLTGGAITKKDRADLKFALLEGVDFIGVSFVQCPEDIRTVRRIMQQSKRVIPIVAKIERQVAVSRLDDIMEEADIAMVARGDLGVEMPLEEIPILQKRIIASSAHRKKPVIVATQMLESMVEHERPTRAEVTDVSNAVFEGVDAVMLSGETSVGIDPANAVATMAKIVGAAEESPYQPHASYIPDEARESIVSATARAAGFIAEDMQAKAICVFTMTGRSAQLVSAQRPLVGILSMTSTDDAARRSTLSWGVTAIKIAKWRSVEAMITAGIKALKRKGIVEEGDLIVAVSGTTAIVGATNMIKVIEV